MYVDDLNLWADTNELAEEVYRRDNIKVIDYNNSNRCYIFFASNHLFYPNTRDNFIKTMIEKDRFEWVRISSDPRVVQTAGRVILVRDIYKQWYSVGVSKELNTTDKLIDRLAELSDGFETITIGVSAGGYIAALVAAKINAKICYDISGQLTLEQVVKEFYVRRNGHKVEQSPYYDIKEIIGGSDCKFFYFYPAYYKRDKDMYLKIAQYDNVYGFGFNQKNHAANMMPSNYPFIITRDEEYLLKLYRRYDGKVINNIEFFFRTVNCLYWIPLAFRETKQYIIRVIHRMQGKFV